MKDKIAIPYGLTKLNYGSTLQAYALKEQIQEITGCPCDLIWRKGNLFKYYNINVGKILRVMQTAALHPYTLKPILKSVFGLLKSNDGQKYNEKSREKFEDFKNKNFEVYLYASTDLKKISQQYRKIVSCSDQVWNSWDYYIEPIYYLRFCPKEKRVSYAGSMGSDTLSPWNRRKISKYLSEIPYLSVREQSAVSICREDIHRRAELVADPTLLYTKEEWMKKLQIKKLNESYCLVYFLKKPSEEAMKAISYMEEKYKIVVIPYSIDERWKAVSAGPKEFVRLVYNADFVLTDSYHGSLFSINFEKPFLAFERPYSKRNENTRFDSIADITGLEDRFLTDHSSWKFVIDQEIDYDRVSEKVENFRQKSKRYLTEALL